MSETALTDAFIYDGIRTPFGRHAGALAPVRPDDLLAHVIRTVVEKNDFPKEALRMLLPVTQTRPVKIAGMLDASPRFLQGCPLRLVD